MAFQKFSTHIPQHPARSLFQACRIFDPTYFHLGDIHRKDIRRYSIIKELENPSDSLLHEWSIYCGLEFTGIIEDIELDKYWLNMKPQLPIISNIALDYIWLPISSCSVERSFSLYNTILDSDRQNLSQDSLKQFNMIYYNNI